MSVSMGTMLGQLFAGLLMLVLFGGLIYLAFLIPASLRRIASALEQIAQEQKRRNDDDIGR